MALRELYYDMEAAAQQSHPWTAALAVGAVLRSAEVECGEVAAWPMAGGGPAVLLTRLPEVIETGARRHHCQAFHRAAPLIGR